MSGVGIIPFPLHSLRGMVFFLFGSIRVNDHGARFSPTRGAGELCFRSVGPTMFVEARGVDHVFKKNSGL